MDNRVEPPQSWLADGASEDAAPIADSDQASAEEWIDGQEPLAGARGGAAGTAGSVAVGYGSPASEYSTQVGDYGAAVGDYQATAGGYGGALGDAPSNGDYYSVGQDPVPAGDADHPGVPPFPAQVSAQVSANPSPGMAARITGPFAALTRPRLKKGTRFAKPGRGLNGAVGQDVPGQDVPGQDPPGLANSAGPAGLVGPTAPAGPAAARRAQLVLSRVEPWSVMKFSFMVSLVGWVILFVAVAVLYYVLNKLGVFHAVQNTISNVTSTKTSPGADVGSKWFSASRILGYTMLIGAVNVILITALATVGAVIYNLVTHLAGGVEVTLEETDLPTDRRVRYPDSASPRWQCVRAAGL